MSTWTHFDLWLVALGRGIPVLFAAGVAIVQTIIERKKSEEKAIPPKKKFVWHNILTALIILGCLGNLIVLYYDQLSALESKTREMEAQKRGTAASDSVIFLLKAMQPASLPKRLQVLLDEISPKIMPSLKGGHSLYYEGAIPDPQYVRLMVLSKENGAGDYIEIHPCVAGMVFDNSPSGETTIKHNVKFTAYPKLLQEK